MATIDKLDIGIYIQYARRTQLVEQVHEQFRLEEAGSIPPQTQLLDISPKLSELDILIGVVPVVRPWAHFTAPSQFRFQRRSPFGFFRVAPSLGSFADEERHERVLEDIQCTTDEQLEQKASLQKCFKQINKINDWLSFIVGRVGQFLKG